MNWELLNPSEKEAQLQPSLHSEVLDFCQSLSTAILRDPDSRQFPDLIGLGAWLRKKNLEEILKPYFHQTLKPLGRVFHSAPANVDSLFVYSAILSLICGNINLIRLSNRAGGSSVVLVKHLQRTGKDYPEINARLQLVRCEHDDESLNKWISQADGRVLWGSNEGIQAMRSKSFPAHGREISFSHKFSTAMLNANAVIQANSEATDNLAKNFIKDNLTFAQQACSSAKLIFWIGKEEQINKAKSIFWSKIQTHMPGQTLKDNEHYQALSSAQRIILEGTDKEKKVKSYGEIITLDTNSFYPYQENEHQGCGFFIQLNRNEVSKIDYPFSSQHQTMSYWGFEDQEIQDWSSKQLSGIDRVVKVGEALDFNITWDGVNLIHAFSRRLGFNH